MGFAEVMAALGRSYSTVRNWRDRDRRFPKPVATLRCGWVWRAADVEAYAAVTRNRARRATLSQQGVVMANGMANGMGPWREPHDVTRGLSDAHDRRITNWVLAIALAWLALVAAYALAETLTSRACLGAGYTAGRVTATFGRYCTARVDNSDVVLPLAEARRRPRR